MSYSLFTLSSFCRICFQKDQLPGHFDCEHMDMAHRKKQGFGIFAIKLVPVEWHTHCTSASGEAELLLSVKAGEETARETLLEGRGSSVWTTNQW